MTTLQSVIDNFSAPTGRLLIIVANGAGAYSLGNRSKAIA